jgi:EAL domain-containing protein (putative c-di-GMP-specific phosphodiesterase class I)
VSPGEFVSVAEETGLIVPMGEWALKQACKDAVTWPPQITVAVNLSPAQFKSKHLVQAVHDALASSGLPASRLELEITELVLIEDNEGAFTILHELRDLGIRIAMDDFGTGYSSLGYLRAFPFDKIKIDQSFIQDLPHKEESLTCRGRPRQQPRHHHHSGGRRNAGTADKCHLRGVHRVSGPPLQQGPARLGTE